MNETIIQQEPKKKKSKSLKVLLIIAIVLVVLAIVLTVVLFISLFLGEKQPVTPETFSAVMQEHGYAVTDLTDRENATNVYWANKSNFEQSAAAAGASSYKNVNGRNLAKKTMRVGGRYMLVSQIGDTVVYVSADEVHKDAI